jgi:hypothetical protein
MLKHKLQDFQDNLSNRDRPTISLRKAANTPGYYTRQDQQLAIQEGGISVNVGPAFVEKHSKKISVQNVIHPQGSNQQTVASGKSQERIINKPNNSITAGNPNTRKQQSQGNTSPQQTSSNALVVSDKENIVNSRKQTDTQLSSDNKSPYFQAKAEEEIKQQGTESLPLGKYEAGRVTRTNESDEEATLVNPVKNLVFDYKEMNIKSEERNMTMSSNRDTVSSNGQMTKTVLKPIVNSKSIDQSSDGNTLVHNRLDTDRLVKASLTGSRGLEYVNENHNMVKKVSKEITNEINKIKRTLSSASKSPGRNIGDSTPERSKETPSSARKLMEYSGAKNTRINIDLDKVDLPYMNNRTGSLIPIQER